MAGWRDYAAKLDAELRILLHGYENPAPETAAPPDEPIFIALTHHGDIAALEAAGLEVGSYTRSTAYGATTFEGLAALAEHPQVEFIERQHKPRAGLDKSVPDIKANQVWGLIGNHYSGYTGRGVIIGIIDTGIDFQHKAFRHPNGKSRILRIWDQTLDVEVVGEESPKPITDPKIHDGPPGTVQLLDYGVEYTQEHIDNAISDSATGLKARHKDVDGHGSHVAGIAAGNGSQAGGCANAFTYVGVAGEADIVVVRLWGLTKGDKPRPVSRSNVTIDAIRYIFNVAGDKPAVLNLSFGLYHAIMDGSDPQCRDIDALLTNNPVARAIVVIAGNNAEAGLHASTTVAAGPPAPEKVLRLPFWIEEGDPEKRHVLVRYDGLRMSAQVTSPGGLMPWVGPGGIDDLPINGVGSSVKLISDANEIAITITPPPSGKNLHGPWLLELRNADTTEKQVDAFLRFTDSKDPHHPRWTEHVTNQMTLHELAIAEHAISVGSCRESGSLSDFSSRGPTRRVVVVNPKPEIVAPGEKITSVALPKERKCEKCCCDCCVDFYVDLDGTSMAAPHVAGAVALMLHRNPSLTHDEIKTLLMAGAVRPPTGTPPTDMTGWGAGKADVKAAIGLVVEKNPPLPRMAAAEAASARFASLQAALAETPRGPLFEELFGKYAAEVWTLIQDNRRVATIWHRCRGPVWVRLALRAVHMPDAELPLKVDETDFRDSVRRFAGALKRFGSAPLGHEVEIWEGEVARIEDGMSLKQLIRVLGDDASDMPLASAGAA